MSPAAAIAARPVRRPAQQPAHRPPLQVVGRRRTRRRQVAPLLSVMVVAASLLLVVIGHSELAQGQVRLASEQAQITAAQTAHRQDLLSVAQLENPTRIVGAAEKTLHMVAPAQVTQLPHVSLTTPLPAATVTPTTAPPLAASAASPGP